MNTQDQLKAYQNWVCEYVDRDFEPSMLTIMFKELNGSQAARQQQIYREVARIYAYLLTRFHNHPKRMPTENMPFLIGCVDWKVTKSVKSKIAKTPGANNNEGMHFGSMFLLPPRTRSPMNLADMVDRERATLLRRSPLTNIHVEMIRETPEKATGYVLKSVERHRIDPGDILILPAKR